MPARLHTSRYSDCHARSTVSVFAASHSCQISARQGFCIVCPVVKGPQAVTCKSWYQSSQEILELPRYAESQQPQTRMCTPHMIALAVLPSTQHSEKNPPYLRTEKVLPYSIWSPHTLPIIRIVNATKISVHKAVLKFILRLQDATHHAMKLRCTICVVLPDRGVIVSDHVE